MKNREELRKELKDVLESIEMVYENKDNYKGAYYIEVMTRLLDEKRRLKGEIMRGYNFG